MRRKNGFGAVPLGSRLYANVPGYAVQIGRVNAEILRAMSQTFLACRPGGGQ